MPPNAKLMSWRAELRQRILDELRGRDPSSPEALQFAVAGMLEMHFSPRELSEVVGPSQTTGLVAGLRAGRFRGSAPYRKVSWLRPSWSVYAIQKFQPMS